MISQITWMLNRIDNEDVILQSVLLYNTLMIMDGSRLNEAANFFDPIDNIVRLCRDSKNYQIQITSVLCLKNATAIFYISISQVTVFQNVQWLIDLKECSDQNIHEHVLAILRNISITSNTGFRFNTCLAKVIRLVLQLLDVSNIKKSRNNINIRLHSLCIICNISTHDSAAQLICQIGGPELFQTLFSIVELQNSKEETRMALSCFRNLCIDNLACSSILSIGAPKVVRLILAGNNDFRIECMQIIRNLLIQSEECFHYLYQTDGLLPEIIESTRSSNFQVQQCAIDIINHLISRGKGHILNDLINEGCLKALLIIIEGESEIKIAATECFKKLQLHQQSQQSALPFNDHWTRIWHEWRTADTLANDKSSTRGPKKSSKRIKSAKRAKAVKAL